MEPSKTWPETTPFTILPSKQSNALIVACITKKAIIAASAATSFLLFDIPNAIETAKINGRLSNKILPTFFNKIKTLYKKVPCPNIELKCNAIIVVSLVKELPTPKKIPATGSTAIGNIKDFPILCKKLKT